MFVNPSISTGGDVGRMNIESAHSRRKENGSRHDSIRSEGGRSRVFSCREIVCSLKIFAHAIKWLIASPV